MSTPFTRHLTFTTNHLGKEATLLLIFDKPVDGLYTDKFPVLWKRIKFGSQGNFAASVTYESQLAISKAEVTHSSDVIIGAAATAFIDIGQSTTLIKDSQGFYNFTDAEEGQKGLLTAVNGTPEKEDITIGFIKPNTIRIPTPVLYFPDVKPSSTVQTKFTPILRAYVSPLAFQENQVIRAELNAECVWERDLTELAPSTKWGLSLDAESGKYAIAPVE